METANPTDFTDPIEYLYAEHELHKEFCDSMEEIADCLPNDVDRAKAGEAARVLRNELPLHHRIEETALFPLLIKYSAEDDNMAEIVDRLKEEHVIEAGFSEELIEVLEILATGAPLENANMVGYMLRGFFESYRRHLMWENNVVLSFARRRLPSKALTEMAATVLRLHKELHREKSIEKVDFDQGAGSGAVKKSSH